MIYNCFSYKCISFLVDKKNVALDGNCCLVANMVVEIDREVIQGIWLYFFTKMNYLAR